MRSGQHLSDGGYCEKSVPGPRSSLCKGPEAAAQSVTGGVGVAAVQTVRRCAVRVGRGAHAQSLGSRALSLENDEPVTGFKQKGGLISFLFWKYLSACSLENDGGRQRAAGRRGSFHSHTYERRQQLEHRR